MFVAAPPPGLVYFEHVRFCFQNILQYDYFAWRCIIDACVGQIHTLSICTAMVRESPNSSKFWILIEKLTITWNTCHLIDDFLIICQHSVLFVLYKTHRLSEWDWLEWSSLFVFLIGPARCNIFPAHSVFFLVVFTRILLCSVYIYIYEPRQSNLCLRAFRHDKF